ncbi:hypothetical protein MGAST_27950 [Mycobacterium gastri 'Wayne']|nr:hypothetical protein MGAST_27950 [Mycobacterium gastri 'Wayne']
MPGLGHREAAADVEVDDLVMALGAQVLDGTAEQAPPHSGLDHQGQIRHGQHLDHRDRRAHVAGAAMFLAEAVFGGARGGQKLHLLGHLGAGDDGVGCVVRAEDLQVQPPYPNRNLVNHGVGKRRYRRPNTEGTYVVSPRWV